MATILDQHGQPIRSRQRRSLRAKYDAAQTITDNARHWGNTDSLSADAANSAAVRKTLRERARYEVANNGWARSMVETLAHEVIGTGPRVQVEMGSRTANAWVERRFAAWAAKVHLGRKLRTLRKAKAQDGEGLALLVNNPRLGDVQLDIRPLECDQLTTPDVAWQRNQVDGIDFDELGYPVRYHILRDHPGETHYGIDPFREITPAPGPDEVIHVFRRDRPGQHRGVPELTPALPLFSRLRRYNLAVLQAAENIASVAMALKTQHTDVTAGFGPSGDSDDEPASYETFDTFDLERGLVTVLPDGTDLYQPKSEQPSSTHEEFVRCVLAEAFACVCMPYSVGAADSSQENFASGKLTRLGFKRAVEVERRLDWDGEVQRIVAAWFAEAKYAMPDALRATLRDPSEWTVQVYWDGVEDIDPEKAARARDTALQSGQTGYAALFAEQGKDWEREQEAQAKAIGLTVKDYRARLATKLLGPAPTKTNDTNQEQPDAQPETADSSGE